MGKNIYVGNLTWDATEDDLLALFGKYGKVTRARVAIDRETGRSRGFGFVEMGNDSEADRAINALNGFQHERRPLTVNEATPREDSGLNLRLSLPDPRDSSTNVAVKTLPVTKPEPETATLVCDPSPGLQPLLAPPELAVEQASSVVLCNTLDQFVSELVTLVAGKVKTSELNIRFTFEPGRRLAAPAFPGPEETTLRRFDDFCRQWHAKTVQQKDGLVVLAINAAPSIWHKLLGRRLGLEIRLQFLPVTLEQHKAEVAVVVRPFGCDQEQATRLLEELGPKLLQGVRDVLQPNPDQRDGWRLAIRQRVQVRPVINGAPAEAIECFTKDISSGGIGFYLPGELPASQVYVTLPELESIAPYSALAQVVPKQPTKEGWFEVGAAFLISHKERG